MEMIDDNVYTTDLGNANTLTCKTYDPHGFWRWSIVKGRLPEYMKGHYTNVEEANKDFIRYMSDKTEKV